MEEYEVIQTSPLRRLEKRMEDMESVSSSSEVRRLIDQIIEMIKSNQGIINEIIRADNELRSEIAKLPDKIDSLLSTMNEFMEMLKATSAEETATDIGEEMTGPLVKKLSELVEHNRKNVEVSQAVLTSLGLIDKRLKRIYLQSETMRR